jgi:hypothetical protein
MVFVHLLTAVAIPARAASTVASRPNIILVITDDQGYAPIGRHGHPWIQTPNLDSLYDHSVRFTRFLVSPTCAPTRSALMTGRDPLENGVTHTLFERERLTLDATTLVLPPLLHRVRGTKRNAGHPRLGEAEVVDSHMANTRPHPYRKLQVYETF